ncbi:hypothetical protein EBA29_00732 [Bacillus velezensis]|nr:hypothetical protein EBA29_00732 [Bacillus velezensis]
MNIKDSRPTGGLKLLYAKGVKNLKIFLADVKKGLESSSPSHQIGQIPAQTSFA